MNEINKIDFGLNGDRIRLLVVIACYGSKNLELLKQLIGGYQSMAMDVDIVVVSEAPKALGAGVKVVVGLPSENPWSLPFAHKPIFAQYVDQYDLFIYSEDDMEVTEENIHAFLRAAPHLAEDEIAGFLRYEVDKSGTWSIPEAHGNYHWKPESVKQRGDYIVSEFSNEHAAFYLLTQAQLKKAIASGGFLRAPYEGRYDMLCSAATDPYTRCGFRKVICISALEDFLIHHLSDRYADQLGVSLANFNEQIQTQKAIVEETHPVSSLYEMKSYPVKNEWLKNYYEEPSEELFNLVPNGIDNILSVGCGWGATEAKLKERGAVVTAIPMDSIIGAEAGRLGINVVYGALDECVEQLDGRVFDCVIMTNLLHLLPNPKQAVEQCARFVAQGGTFVIVGPNLGTARILAKRVLGVGDYRKLGVFDESGVHAFTPAELKGYLKKSGLGVAAVRWFNSAPVNGIEGKLRALGAGNWALQATRQL